MRARWSLAATAVAMGLAGCGGGEVIAPSPDDIDLGGVWTVARAGDVVAVPGREPSVEFLDDGRRIRLVVSECWEATADVSIEERSIRVADLVPEELQPCGGDVREFAGLVHDGFAGATTLDGAPGRLVITGQGEELLLVRGHIEPTLEEQRLLDTLHGLAWRYVDGDAPADPDLPTLRFGPSSVSADGSCGFRAEWQYRGEDLVRIGELTPSADDACGDHEARARAALLDVLEGVERIALEPAARTMRLRGREGDLLFEAVEP